MQLVARPNWPRPAELVEAGADDPAGGLELALDQQPHGHRRGVPAARCEPAEDRFARGGGVEVEGLWVEFRGERLDARFVDAQPARRVGLADGKVLEEFHSGVTYAAVSPPSTRNSVPVT